MKHVGTKLTFNSFSTPRRAVGVAWRTTHAARRAADAVLSLPIHPRYFGPTNQNRLNFGNLLLAFDGQ